MECHEWYAGAHHLLICAVAHADTFPVYFELLLAGQRLDRVAGQAASTVFQVFGVTFVRIRDSNPTYSSICVAHSIRLTV